MQTRDRHALPHVGLIAFSSSKLVGVTAAGAHFGPPGYETALYIAGLAPLVLGGAGPLAVESLIEKRKGSGRAAHPIRQ